MSVDFPDWVNTAPATDPKLIKQQLFDLERRMSLYQQMGAEFPKSLTWELLSCTKSLLRNQEANGNESFGEHSYLNYNHPGE